MLRSMEAQCHKEHLNRGPENTNDEDRDDSQGSSKLHCDRVSVRNWMGTYVVSYTTYLTQSLSSWSMISF